MIDVSHENCEKINYLPRRDRSSTLSMHETSLVVRLGIRGWVLPLQLQPLCPGIPTKKTVPEKPKSQDLDSHCQHG